MWKWNKWRKAKDNMVNQDNTNNAEQADNLDNTVQTSRPDIAVQTDNRGNAMRTDRLDEAAQALTAAILGSREYLTYRAELAKVLQVPDLKAQIDEFRRRNFQLQCSADIDFAKMEHFDREYEDFLNNPLVSDFLETELAFCRRMQQIENSIVAALDFQ